MSFGLSFSPFFARAPKSHIGGSGMTASPGLTQSLSALARAPSSAIFSFPYPWGSPGLGSPRLDDLWAGNQSVFVRTDSWFVSDAFDLHSCFLKNHYRDSCNANAGPSCGPSADSTHAVRSTATLEDHVRKDRTLLQLLLLMGSILVPLARGFLALALLGVMRLWSRHAPSSALGSLLGFPLRGKYGGFVIPMGKAASTDAILDWSTPKPRSCKRPSRQPKSLRRSILGSLGVILGLPTTPVPFAVSFPCACWLINPDCVAGMAREGWPNDWPSGRPETPVFTPVITAGVCDAWSPCHDPERITRAEDNILVRDIPWQADCPEPSGDSLLGCCVYTPHYCPVSLAIRMPPHADLRYAMDVLLDCAPGVPEGLFNAMVPIHPQRTPGYLSVIRFPAHIRGVHEGYAAVICDLTRIGGSYFATVLPNNLSHEALVSFLAPLVPASDDPMRFFVGCRTKAWPVEALVTLRDGDAISAVRNLDSTVPRHRAESLHDRGMWGPMHQFFEPAYQQATCVLHRDQRFCVDISPSQGIDLFDQVVSLLSLDAASTAVCTFPIEDLEVQGTRCQRIVTVADVAAPTGGYREPVRQDFFVLCDLRPLGLKPRFVYAHLPRLHLPSLIADLGIALPAAFQVGVAGARVSDDVVRISCNCTLLFYAKEAEPDDLDDLVSIADLSPAPESPDSFSEENRRSEQTPIDAAVLLASQHMDTTIPEGHGWNLGVEGTHHHVDNGLSSAAHQAHVPPCTENSAAQGMPVPWTYAEYCEHMAGAWDATSSEQGASAPTLSQYKGRMLRLPTRVSLRLTKRPVQPSLRLSAP